MVESNEWYKDWFDETYLSLYRHRDLNEARSFLEWLADKFGREAALGVADLACGAGRHSWIMAREHKWRVTALDLSAPLLRLAFTGEFIKYQTGRPIRRFDDLQIPGFVRGDLRRLPYESKSFGLVINMFTSFGYFTSDGQNLDALNEMARVVKNEGVVIIDHLNRESVLDNLVAESEESINDYRIVQKRRYDNTLKRIIKDIRIIDNMGSLREVRESVRVFSYNELGTFLERAGLIIEGAIGDYQGSEYNEKTSPRMIIWARKTV